MDEVEVSEGDWVIFNDSGYRPLDVTCRKAAKVTPKLVKFEGTRYPRQCNRITVIAAFADEMAANRVLSQINGGVSGDFERRRRAAEEERSRRITEALKSAKERVATIIASEMA